MRRLPACGAPHLARSTKYHSLVVSYAQAGRHRYVLRERYTLVVPTPSVTSLTSEIVALFREHASDGRRDFMAGYAPSGERFIGVAVPVIRRAANAARAQLPELRDRMRLARQLLALGFAETRQAAYELLARDATALSTRAIESLGRGIDNWGSVDAFSTLIAGPAWREGTLSDRDIHRWARSDDRWWRRAALVATTGLNLPSRGGRGDARRTIALCRRLADDDDLFVRKALSWALRELVRWDAAAVREFIASHHAVLAAFVIRDVETKLNTGRKNPRR